MPERPVEATAGAGAGARAANRRRPGDRQGAGASASFDCAALLTAQDLYNMCGVKEPFGRDSLETGEGPTSCARSAGDRGRSVRFVVGVYPHVESARAVSGVDEPGEVRFAREPAGTIAAHMRRGNVAVAVTAPHVAGAEPICTRDQLGKLAMVVDSRLP